MDLTQAAPESFQHSTSHCPSAEAGEDLLLLLPQPRGAHSAHTAQPCSVQVLLHSCVLAEIHKSHVHEVSSYSWDPSAMAFGSSCIPEVFQPLLSIPLLQGQEMKEFLQGVF